MSKKNNSKKNKSKTPKEFIGENGELKLDPETRQNMCRFDAEVRAARNQFTLDQIRLAQYIQSIDKDGIIVRSQAALQATALHVQEMEGRYNAVRQEVEKKLSINLNDYSFDDETGLLHRHKAKEETAPQS